MEADTLVREQEQPELPSEEMEQKFDLWNEEYTVDSLTDLSSSQIKSKQWEFEAEVEELLTTHRPGRRVANRPALSYLCNKPPYTAEEWKEARETIRHEAQKVRMRFERAEGIVMAEEKERSYTTKIIESLSNIRVNVNIGSIL